MLSLLHLSYISIEAHATKGNISVMIYITKPEYMQNNYIGNLMTSFFNGNFISVPEIYFKVIGLPFENTLNFVNNNSLFTPYAFNYHHNLASWIVNNLDVVNYLLQQHCSLWWFFKLLTLIFSSIIILWFFSGIITLFSWLVYLITYILSRLAKNPLMWLIIISLFIGITDAFSFADEISEHTSLPLHDIRLIIIGISGMFAMVCGTLFDYFSLCMYITNTVTNDCLTSDGFLHRLLLNLCGFVWIQANVFLTNTLFTVVQGIPDLVSFLVGSTVGIACTTFWDFLSIPSNNQAYNIFNSFIRTLLDSSSFAGIVYSTFISWGWYNFSNVTRLTSLIIGTISSILSAYLMHLQILVRLFPRANNLNLMAPNVFLGPWVFRLNNLSLNDQRFVSGTNWPLFRQSIFFSILWNITWNIVVFSTNPLIEWWTIFVNNSPYSNNLLNISVLLLCAGVAIATTPNFYFRFSDPSRVTTLRLFIMSVCLYIYTSSYIIFNAIIYNMFW